MTGFSSQYILKEKNLLERNICLKQSQTRSMDQNCIWIIWLNLNPARGSLPLILLCFHTNLQCVALIRFLHFQTELTWKQQFFNYCKNSNEVLGKNVWTKQYLEKIGKENNFVARYGSVNRIIFGAININF